jgi:hypothetical protein
MEGNIFRLSSCKGQKRSEVKKEATTIETLYSLLKEHALHAVLQ